jgi:hypothetical protein
LNYCRTKGLESSAPLLWMKGHLECTENRFTKPYLHQNQIPIVEFCSSEWKFSGVGTVRTLNGPWVKPCPVAYRCGSYPWLPLLGPRGGVSYAPARGQFGAKLFVPMTHELSELEFSYKDKGDIALVKERAPAWKQVDRTRKFYRCNYRRLSCLACQTR